MTDTDLPSSRLSPRLLSSQLRPWLLPAFKFVRSVGNADMSSCSRSCFSTRVITFPLFMLSLAVEQSSPSSRGSWGSWGYSYVGSCVGGWWRGDIRAICVMSLVRANTMGVRDDVDTTCVAQNRRASQDPTTTEHTPLGDVNMSNGSIKVRAKTQPQRSIHRYATSICSTDQ